MHLVTLSFDDGFRKSCLETARLFEQAGLRASFNVVAAPERITEQHLDACITALLAEPSGWLVYNTHGLDDEGWGPIGSAYLARLLDRLQAEPTVRVVTTGSVFAALDGGRNFAPAVSTP